MNQQPRHREGACQSCPYLNEVDAYALLIVDPTDGKPMHIKALTLCGTCAQDYRRGGFLVLVQRPGS